MRYTIVGGGIAAVSAIKAIRNLDPDAHITVVSAEQHCFYYRPMTPLMVNGDRARDEILHDHSQLPEISLIHDRAVALRSETREVELASGDTVPYDRLLIATGSSPVVPKIPGIEAPNIYYLRTLEDAQRLNQAAQDATQAVVLGGGLVGIKKACALRSLGLEVTVVEQRENILHPRLDQEAAAMVAEKLTARGMKLITGDSVAEIHPGGKGVRLASGWAMNVDLLCMAVGVRPNIDWLAGNGLATNRALIVDKRLRTNIDNIFAAGDVAETRDLITHAPLVGGLWTNAVEMGRAAGVNMAGGKSRYEGGLEVLNATEIEGIPIIAVGDVLARGKESDTISRRWGDTYRKLVFQGDRLTGALFVGEVKNAGVYTALIRSRTRLGRLKETARQRTLSYADFCASH